MARSFRNIPTPRFPALGAVVLAATLAASPAAAEAPYPTVDFQGEWVLSDDKGTEIRAGMHYSAALKKMRINMNQPGMEMSSVRDMGTGEMLMWSNQMPGMAMRLPTAKDDEFDGEATDETKTIGGENCTVWTLKGAAACLTEENIPIETTGQGFTASLKNLQRTTQDSALFEVPDGLNIMDMPANMPGGMKPGQGMPF